MVFLAGLFRMFAVFLYVTGRVFIMVVIYIAVGLAREPVTLRAFFTILSLSWPLAVNIYRHITLGVIELLEASVAVLRMKVRSVPLLCVACSALLLWPESKQEVQL